MPLPLIEKVKDEIERMASAGVIEAVDEPTDWCAPIVVVPKQSGDVRIYVDLTKLNEAVRRENYIIPKVESTLGSIASKGTSTRNSMQIPDFIKSSSARTVPG